VIIQKVELLAAGESRTQAGKQLAPAPTANDVLSPN
jgi:hypothetical protein